MQIFPITKSPMNVLLNLCLPGVPMRFPIIQNPLAWLLALVLLSVAVPVFAQQSAPQKATRDDLTIDPATLMQPWKGDLDGMLKRRLIRVLTVNSKTFYFQDKGVQRGTTYDMFHLFEQDLNKKLEKEGKLSEASPGAGGVHSDGPG